MKSANLLKNRFAIGVLAGALTLSMVVLLLAGDVSKNLAQKKLAMQLATTNRLVNKHYLAVSQSALAQLAGLYSARAICKGDLSPGDAGTTRILEGMLFGMDVRMLFIVDERGTILASTDQGNGLVGSKCSIAPYFLEAMKGEQFLYGDIDRATGKRELYLSSPVKTTRKGNIIGVVVARLSLQPLDRMLADQSRPTAWVSPAGIIFASNHPKWLFYRAVKISESRLQSILASHQFANRPLPALPFSLDAIQPHPGSGIMAAWSDGQLAGWRLVTWDRVRYPLGPAILATVCLLGLYAAMISWLAISRKKRLAEKQLNEFSADYETIFNAAGDAIFVHDPGTGAILDVNDRMCELFGCTREEALKLNVGDLSSGQFPYTVEQAQKWIYKAATEGIQTFEWYSRDRAGRLFWSEVTLKLCQLHGVKKALAFVRDITEQKKAREALKASEEHVKTIVNSIEAGVVIIDPETHAIEYVNPAAVKMSGFDEHEVLGHVCHHLLCPAEKGKCPLTDLSQVLESSERTLLRKNGQALDILKTVKQIEINGRPKLIESFFDISHLKQTQARLNQTLQNFEEQTRKAKFLAQEAQAANVAKSEFLARMSHEIRTPMNGVIGFTDILQETRLDDEQKDYVDTIKRSGESLLDLLNDILDFSKIEAGQLDLENVDFDPEITAHDVCELIRPRIGNRPVELLCHVANDVPVAVSGDPGRFRQVLVNLMGNAVKFTESGEIELSLDVERTSEQRVKLHVTVRDSGVGIPADKLGTIFDVFQQADGSITRKFGGTGLGLAICRQIARLMDGNVWAESPACPALQEDISGRRSQAPVPGSGSIFHFTGWLHQSKMRKMHRTVQAPLTDKKVLIVDDNQRNLKILAHLLKNAGMHVVSLAYPKQVVPTLRHAQQGKAPFDMVILDIQMPVRNGYEVARDIQRLKSGTRHLPLLALSSSVDREAERCRRAGFDGFLPKPVRRKKLLEMIARLLTKPQQTAMESAQPPAIVTQHSLRDEAKRAARILLVEDNLVNQKLAQMMLAKAGYGVETALNGLQAVKKYTQDPENYDLIFMDVQMPEMNGLQATQEIRKRENGNHAAEPARRIPIVAMTAQAMKGDREQCLAAGMDDYVSKPIKREIVFDMVKKWVLD